MSTTVFFTEGCCFGLPKIEKRRGTVNSSQARSLTKDCDMIRLLLLSFLLAIIDQNGTCGKPVHGDIRSILQVDFSDAADPANDLQAKRNSYHAPRGPEVLNPADPSSLCYLIQESDTESQISCRLRFTRSKFNFNPFGLRFGKRQGGILAGEVRKLDPQGSSKMMQSLLKPGLDRMIEMCGEMWGENC